MWKAIGIVLLAFIGISTVGFAFNILSQPARIISKTQEGQLTTTKSFDMNSLNQTRIWYEH